MIVIVTSEADPASLNIRGKLLQLGRWESVERFDDSPVYRAGEKTLLTLRDMHLYRDRLDREVEAGLGERPELIIYASRHRSESGMKAFTVHPLGNFGEAAYGGLPGELVPSAPHWMTQALRLLKERVGGLEHMVSFEATHHGPYLETPAFYIELGSDETAWREEEPAGVIAEVLLELTPVENPIALGLGGGHYLPRITDVALERKVSFGHMVPNYAFETLDQAMVQQAVDRTPGVSIAYLHRKALKGEVRARVIEMVEACGVKLVREADLGTL